eukprot:6193005-Pleurochrysis_carterae.AAC.3
MLLHDEGEIQALAATAPKFFNFVTAKTPKTPSPLRPERGDGITVVYWTCDVEALGMQRSDSKEGRPRPPHPAL